MSEFGNETSSTALRLGEKSIEELRKFFKFLLERKEKKINLKLQKEKLDAMKLQKGERIAKLKVEGKAGYVKAKLLQRTGESLIGIKLTLNEQQMKDFAWISKKYGLLYTSISDTRQSGEKVRTVYVREKDLATIKAVTDRMMEDLQLKAVDDVITELNNKPDKSAHDLADLAYLEREKEDILRSGTRAFNNENAEIIFNDVCGGLQDKSLSFDKSLNRFTYRDFSRDMPYYICERTNPTSYIEMISTHDDFAGEQYTRTDYRVFNNGVEQTADIERCKDGKFTDERFKSRPKDYWQELKGEMKQKGGFTDDIVIFNTRAEFDRYQQLYKKSVRENSIQEQTGGEYRDYASATDQLKKQFNGYNAQLNENGLAVDKITKQPFDIIEAKSDAEMFRAAESVIIAKQIVNYKTLSEAQVKLAMDKQLLDRVEQTLKDMPQSDPHRVSTVKEQATLVAEVKNGEHHIENGLQSEKELIVDRNQLSGIYAVNEVDKEYVAQHQQQAEKERTTGDERDARNHKEERKEFDRDTHTMEEWKGQVLDRRAQMEKNIPVAEKGIEKAMPSKDDR